MTKNLKLLMLLTIGLFLITPSFAQRMTPSEIRKQKEKEDAEKKKEDGEKAPEKKLTPAERRAQLKNNMNKEEIFGDDDAAFSGTSVPDKWKNESAVVIYQKMDYSYLRDNSSVNVKEIARKRIKLLDKAAIKEFSEFYFVSDGDIGIKIIKANGTTIDVDTKEAKDVSVDVPLFYKTYYSYSLGYKKLAIPDIEAGDIIDYYYKTNRSSIGDNTEKAYDPFLFTLSSTYPIMGQQFKFTVDRGFFINFNSYHGAPVLTEGEAGIDANGRKRALIKTYELVDKDREKLSKDIWNYPYRTVPTIKFQIVYEANSNMRDARYFIGETGVAKNSVTPEEIQKVIGNEIDGKTDLVGYSSMILGALRDQRNVTDPEKIARAAYYAFRHSFILMHPEKEKEIYFVQEDFFTSVMLNVLKDRKIDAQVVVAVPRNTGSLKEVLLSTELKRAIRVKGKGKKDIYLFPFSNHSTFDLVDTDVEGVEGYAFTPVKNQRVFNYEKVTMPTSTYQQNNINYLLDVTFDNDIEKLTVKRTNTLSGEFKQSKLLLTLFNFDYLKTNTKATCAAAKEAKKDGGKKEAAKTPSQRRQEQLEKEEQEGGGRSSRSKTVAAEEKRKKDAGTEEITQKQKDALKDDLKDDYDFEITSYDDFKLVDPGRFDECPKLIYSESFTTKELINKAGKNYIFNVGKMIGSQFELKEKDMKRDNDIYLSFAKSLTNEITINIPAGYTAEGLSDLNFNVDNASGSFISSAKLDGNKIIIKAEKIYKKNFDKKENWSNMVAMLEAAYKFSQKKVVFKKA